MSRDDDLQYLLWMTETAGLAPQKGVRLLEQFGTAKAVWKASDKQIAECIKLEATERKRLKNRSLAGANWILARCRFQNICILPIYHPDYPDRLRNIYDPPLVLYVRGKLPDFNRLPSVAVVGQRNATFYGTVITERLSYQLSCSGVIVVSGMASGIDSAAHKGAIKGTTPTVAVFGTAIDRCYPAENAGLMRSILYNGAVISEYPPGKKTYGTSFPRRNRIISGLCLGVVVGEAPEKSGSLITAGLALDQGRDVFAVPGAVDAKSSAGCNELIARGAKLVRDARDVLEEYVGLYPLNLEAAQAEVPAEPLSEKKPAKKPARQKPVEEAAATLAEVYQSKTAQSDPILDTLEGILSLEELSRKTGIDTPELLGKLTLLELQGKVASCPVKLMRKSDRIHSVLS